MVRPLDRDRLLAQQEFRHERVPLAGHLEELAGLGRVTLPVEREQRLAVKPVRRGVVVLLEQPGRFLVPVQVQEERRQRIADPLIIVGIEPEHLLEMIDRFLSARHRPELAGQPFASPHVGAGLQDSPEVSGMLLEGLRSEGALPGGDSLLVVFEGFLAAPGVLGEQDVGVGAVG